MPKAGFTFLELLVVLAIIAILSALALPNYRSYVARVHRAEVRAHMLQLAHWLERTATTQGHYPAAEDIPTALTTDPSGRYQLMVQSPDPAQNRGASFAIAAVRNPQGSQADDPCGDYLLDQAGRMQLRNAAAHAEVRDCWLR